MIFDPEVNEESESLATTAVLLREGQGVKVNIMLVGETMIFDLYRVDWFVYLTRFIQFLGNKLLGIKFLSIKSKIITFLTAKKPAKSL